ncbi:hypothetical protein A4X17_15660 [Plantibacter sp. H53]|uniref:hypothetical protein n=1 Tax=unclassified Plantibacter TaxID=2624265 RepID=UPI0007D93347|nr:MULTISPECIES: hypothetical protein [unclassified Plantibacter]OAN32966.1 hypothetical protein A4X17_15660 [Plantibacter sp. H53]OII40105.1 hypothetical protein BIU99_06740 [Plantibacter sp. MMLR14_011]
MSSSTPLPMEQLTAVLNAEVARYAARGWTVSSVQGQQAVLQRQKRIGWFWNLILTLLTGGLWLIVVIIRVVNRKVESLIVTVDAYGRISTRR